MDQLEDYGVFSTGLVQLLNDAQFEPPDTPRIHAILVVLAYEREGVPIGGSINYDKGVGWKLTNTPLDAEEDDE